MLFYICVCICDSWSGADSCAGDNMIKIMKSGCNIGLIPGGFQEATRKNRTELCMHVWHSTEFHNLAHQNNTMYALLYCKFALHITLLALHFISTYLLLFVCICIVLITLMLDVMWILNTAACYIICNIYIYIILCYNNILLCTCVSTVYRRGEHNVYLKKRKGFIKVRVCIMCSGCVHGCVHCFMKTRSSVCA